MKNKTKLMLYLLCGKYKIQSFFRCNKFHKLFSLVLSKYDDTQTAISLWYSRVIFSLPATLFISILQNIIEKLRKKKYKTKVILLFNLTAHNRQWTLQHFFPSSYIFHFVLPLLQLFSFCFQVVACKYFTMNYNRV